MQGLSRILDIVAEEPHPQVPLAHMVAMADARGWGSLLLSGLPFLDNRLPATRRARGSDLWKLEATALAVGPGQSL